MSDLYDFESTDVSQDKKEPLTREVLRRSIVLIAVSAAIGIFVIWILTFDWMMTVMAYTVYIFQLLIGLIIGGVVFHKIRDTVPEWARMVVAAIIGITFIISSVQVFQSHTFVRAYQRVQDSENGE